MTESAQRARVIAIAKTWIGTPYHSGGRIKGKGVDCATLIAEVYAEAGVLPPVPIPHYSPEWHLHQSGEMYMQRVLEYAHEIEGEPLPGDMVLFRFGRCFSHGAIVLQWPRIIHAHMQSICSYDNVERSKWLRQIGENCSEKGRPRPRKFFSPWG